MSPEWGLRGKAPSPHKKRGKAAPMLPIQIGPPFQNRSSPPRRRLAPHRNSAAPFDAHSTSLLHFVKIKRPIHSPLASWTFAMPGRELSLFSAVFRMSVITQFYRWLIAFASILRHPFLLLIRLYWGWEFILSGWGK